MARLVLRPAQDEREKSLVVSLSNHELAIVAPV
jgi:hypothetical protein